MPVVRPFTTPDRMRTSSASTRAVDSPSPLARRLSIRAARAAGSTGTPAAIPSSTAPTPRAVALAEDGQAEGGPKGVLHAGPSRPSRARRLSTGTVSVRQQPSPGTLTRVIRPPWAFLSWSISA